MCVHRRPTAAHTAASLWHQVSASQDNLASPASSISKDRRGGPHVSGPAPTSPPPRKFWRTTDADWAAKRPSLSVPTRLPRHRPALRLCDRPSMAGLGGGKDGGRAMQCAGLVKPVGMMSECVIAFASSAWSGTHAKRAFHPTQRSNARPPRCPPFVGPPGVRGPLGAGAL